MLVSPDLVEDALWHYAEAYEPRRASMASATGPHSSGERLPFRAAFLDRLEERVELRARLSLLDREERAVVVRWYVRGDRPEAIAKAIGRSTRHVYRVRARAIDRIAALGCGDEFTDADVAEFAS